MNFTESLEEGWKTGRLTSTGDVQAGLRFCGPSQPASWDQGTPGGVISALPPAFTLWMQQGLRACQASGQAGWVNPDSAPQSKRTVYVALG